MTIILKRSDASISERPRGTWKPLREGEHLGATICCPKCGQISTLTKHTIKIDGTVEPSVICEWPDIQCVICNWHEMVKLDGFENCLQEGP